MLINRRDARLYYPLEGNVNDYAGGGADASVNGTSTYVDSTSGKAFDFNGSSKMDTGVILDNNKSFTLFLKMNLDTYTAGDKIATKHTAGNTDGWFFQVQAAASDTLRFAVCNAAGSSYVTVDQVIPEGNLYAVRLEVNLGTNITLSTYTTSGVLTESSTAFTDTSYAANTDTICIGNDSVSTNGLDGKIDDVVIVEGILSDEDFYRFYLGLGLEDNVAFSNNYSINFDGVDEYIDCGNDSSLDFENTDTFSFSFWVNTAGVTGLDTILSKWDSSNTRGYFVKLDASGRVQVVLARQQSGGNARIIRTTSTSISTSTWVHICVTYDGSINKSGINVYINGVAETTWATDLDNLDLGEDISVPTYALRIGMQEGVGDYFVGGMDELSVWDKELSSSEVTELYNSGTPTNLKVHSANANLVSWYRLGDRGSVLGTIPDEVGGNDGTPTNLESSDIKLDTP